MPAPGLQLERITRTATVRELELETGRLVLRALAAGDPFLLRRAGCAVTALEAGPARKSLGRVTAALLGARRDEAVSALLSWGVVLERHGEFDAAEEVYAAVYAERATDPGAAMHVARAARKAGRRERALELYRRVGASATDPHMRLLVRIGEALVSERPLTALNEAVREARRVGDREALAVAREERARFQLAAGRVSAAMRDLAVAATRFSSRSDRTRVLHRLADLFAARGDLAAAREILLGALDHGESRHRAHTVQRMRTIARAMGDQLELRRSRGQGSGGLVSLMPARPRDAAPSRAPRLRRWRALLPAAQCPEAL